MNSMAEVVEVCSVDAPASVVWSVLADFDAISSWAPSVDHSCLTTSAVDGVGATRRIQTGRTTVLQTVITWEPERRLAYVITGLPPVVRSVTNTWQLIEFGGTTSGTTKVTLTSSIDAGPRPPQHVVARVVGRALAKASRQMLDGLNRHVQNQQQGATA